MNETKTYDPTIEDITPELRHELRCVDARSYARKLRSDGYVHPDILKITTEIWGTEVAKHIEGCRGTDYCLPTDERDSAEEGIQYQHSVK